MSRLIIGAALGVVVVAGTLLLWRDQAPASEARPIERVVVMAGDTAAPSSPAPSASPPPVAVAAEVPAPVPAGSPPPLPEGLEGSFDPVAFAKSIRAERRDPQWAPGAEDGLKNSVIRLPFMGPEAKTLSAYCGTTRCEVSGNLPRGSDENVNVAMKALQGEQMRNALKILGLQIHGASFGGDGFVMWTVRKPAPSP